MTTLSIKFIGLNLFVADTRSDTLHVLMPDAPGYTTTPSKPGPKEQHHAAIRYDDPGNPGHAKTVKVNKTRIRIPSSARPIGLPFQQGLVNLSTFWTTPNKVHPSIVGNGTLHGAVTSHFVIPGGEVKAEMPMGVWSVLLPGMSIRTTAHYAPVITCTAELNAAALDLPNLVTGSAPGLDRLTATGGRIELTVLHVEDAQLQPGHHCPESTLGDESDHFPAFYQLFGKTTGPNIRLEDVDPPDWEGCVPDAAGLWARIQKSFRSKAALAERSRRGITPFTCMSGGGELGP